LLKGVSLLIALTLEMSMLIIRLRFMQNFRGFLLHSTQRDNEVPCGEKHRSISRISPAFKIPYRKEVPECI